MDAGLERAMASRTALLDAAERLMVEKGYGAVTSRKVADEAGLKPQLVHYYRTMDELFLEMFRAPRRRGVGAACPVELPATAVGRYGSSVPIRKSRRSPRNCWRWPIIAGNCAPRSRSTPRSCGSRLSARSRRRSPSGEPVRRDSSRCAYRRADQRLPRGDDGGVARLLRWSPGDLRTGRVGVDRAGRLSAAILFAACAAVSDVRGDD